MHRGIRSIRLGVNIDHVATLRNARGGVHPDPVRAAQVAIQAGADSITVHLREDRRHIRDDDLERLKRYLTYPINLEMAATDEMLAIALRTAPHACCIVPERREERTTEGGLDVVSGRNSLADHIKALRQSGVRVSLFIEPDHTQIFCAAELGADVIELHTGRYCELALAADTTRTKVELERICNAATVASKAGLEVHAGHGLTFATVSDVAKVPEIVELNIGHFLIGEAVFTGIDNAVHHMRALMDAARTENSSGRAAT